MSCEIVPAQASPMIHNSVIQNLQNDLAGCGWIDLIYPLAVVGEKEIDNNRVLVPMIYGREKNNYIEMFPDSKQRAGCFFELGAGGYQEDRVNDTYRYQISIIFWANLNLLANRDYDFTDELMVSARNSIVNGYYSNDITDVQYTTDKNQVFQKYGYTYQSMFALMYPKTAFKITISMETNINADCFNADSFNTSFSPLC